MSAIYMTNTNVTNVPAGGQLTFDLNEQSGNVIVTSGNNAILRKRGYYQIIATVTFTAADEGDVTINTQRNSVNIPGLTATETITTATTETRTITLQGIVKLNCCEPLAVLTLVNASEIAITTTNVSLSVLY